jgi:hypothetical protein
MSRFLKVFLRDPPAARIQIAGFGKHPAWDDHIDDIGLDTGTLVLTKQLLYAEGIAGQLASGAWDQIEKSDNSVEFNHRFVWARDDQAILGAIWTSADRKGRTRFPLVICAQTSFGASRAIAMLAAPIEQLGALCRAAKTQEEIRDAFNRTQAELNNASIASFDNLRSFEVPDSLENRIVPALITLSAGLRNRRSSGSSDAARAGGSHFRLPAISSRPAENLHFWLDYSGTENPGLRLPVMVLVANGKQYVDLIVGEPHPNDFFCLRANENALPATWIDVHGKQLRKLEADAKEYLRTFKLGSAPSSSHRRHWWSSLFGR